MRGRKVPKGTMKSLVSIHIMEFGISFIGYGESLKVFEPDQSQVLGWLIWRLWGDWMQGGREERSGNPLGGYSYRAGVS